MEQQRELNHKEDVLQIKFVDNFDDEMEELNLRAPHEMVS
jgi:hypothetical protein